MNFHCAIFIGDDDGDDDDNDDDDDDWCWNKKRGCMNVIYIISGKHCSPIFLKIDFCEIGNYDFCILPVCFGRVLYNSVSKGNNGLINAFNFNVYGF